MELRPYQVESKSEVLAKFMQGVTKVIMCKPTGAGKTVTFADIARDSVKAGSIVMIAVDRKELLEQAKDKLIAYGLSPSVITSGRTMRRGASCYVATVQTLAKRKFPQIDLLIVDEAHKQIFDKILTSEAYKDVFTIGATASPHRTGNMTQLSSIYGAIVEKVTINDLIQQGFLCPAMTYSVKMDTSKLHIKGGEYDKKEVSEMFNKRSLYKGTVEKYLKFCPGTKAICFNADVENSIKQTAEFNANGIESFHIDGTTPKHIRENAIQAFKEGKILVLNNVDILTAGFDEWTVETVIVNIVTLSLTKWLQMCGRGSRITPAQFQEVIGYLQKTHFNILDMGGNVYKHGFWEQDRTWSLTHKKGDTVGVAPVKECKPGEVDVTGRWGCGCIVPAPAPVCKFCGFIFPREEKKLLDGEFMMIENYDMLPPELVNKAWSTMTLSELEIVREKRGYKQPWLVRQILLNKNLSLLDYANSQNYKHPKLWVERMENMYLPKAKEPIFFYYQHEPSGHLFKTLKPLNPDEIANQEIATLDKKTFTDLLITENITDSDELILIPENNG